MWTEAKPLWGESHGDVLEAKVRQIVSIGTGMRLSQAFSDSMPSVLQALKFIVTETENTANDFSENHERLHEEGRYLRLNVAHGLERVGLEEYKKLSLIHAATIRYCQLPSVRMALRQFAENHKQNNNSM